MDSVIFRERLWPRPVNLVLGALAGVVVGAVVWPFHETLGYVVGALAAAGVVALLVATAPLVVVDLGDPEVGEGPSLLAGRAHIGAEHLGRAEALDAGGLRAVMGPEADARAYVCHRSWIDHGVRVEVTDPRDPTPYWIMSSRRPEQLVAALGRAGQAAHSEQTSWPPSS